VPATPSAHLINDFGTATQVQLTLTTFFVGMALGQLVGGPVSDQRGRRRLLIAGVMVMTLASVVCALASTITVIMAARSVQGLPAAGPW
jgi:DHA1 family bicyclomycin/chloramphenicol resistance-like MFS transporter